MNYLRKKLNDKNYENNNNNSKKEKEILNNNIYNNASKINYFNKSSKNNQNKAKNNSLQSKFCINISETKKSLESKNINRINNMDNIKKENIKRTELFKPKSKNKYIQNIYSNTTNTNTNNTNKKSNNFSNSTNTNNNKQNDNKDDKIFIDSNSYINQKEILFESSDLEQLNMNILNSNNQKISNKRNKIMHSLDGFKSYSKNSTDNLMKEKENQTYSLFYNKNDIIKVNIVKNNEKNNNRGIYTKSNNKSSTNLKTNLKNNNHLKNSTDYPKIREKHLLYSLSNTNSEKNLNKLIRTNNNDNIRLSTNISKSTKNTLSIKIYLPGYHNKKKSNIKKYQQSFNNIKNPKDNIKIDINRSLDIKQKKFYSISSRVNTHRSSQENKNNQKNKNININIDLCSKKKNISLKKCGNNSVFVPEYKIKLENIKSRIYKLLNIYSLIALKSINNNSNDVSKMNHINENDKI